MIYAPHAERVPPSRTRTGSMSLSTPSSPASPATRALARALAPAPSPTLLRPPAPLAQAAAAAVAAELLQAGLTPPAPRACANCGARATLFCAADAAALCDACDARVHGANALSQRHVRVPLPGVHRWPAPLPPAGDSAVALAARAAACVAAERAGLARSVAGGARLRERAERAAAARSVALARFRAKRARRSFAKRVRYACRKTLADSRPRVKGRFVNAAELGLYHKYGDSYRDFLHELGSPASPGPDPGGGRSVTPDTAQGFCGDDGSLGSSIRSDQPVSPPLLDFDDLVAFGV